MQPYPKHSFNIDLNMSREIAKPNPKRITIMHHLSRQNIQPKAHQDRDKVRVPQEEIIILPIGRHSAEQLLLPLINTEGPKPKATQIQFFVLEPPGNRDRMTKDHTIIHAMCMPRMNSSHARINTEVWILRILMPEHPGGTKSIRVTIMSCNQLIQLIVGL